jgi:hypothetical protein
MNAHLLTDPLTASHLSEDDLDEVLLGFAAPAASAHAASCPDCQARLDSFRGQLAAFNQASSDWSVARSNTISRDLAGHRTALRLTPATLWYSTAAAVLAVAFSISTGLHRESVSLQSARAAQSEVVAEVAPDQGELASDNAMLAAIDSETATPRMAQYGLQPGATRPRAANPQVKD